MPAIQLARLKLQAGRLRDVFSQPAAFARALRQVLESYADYTHRPGQSGEPPPIIHTYNVPAPVLRLILQEISPLARAEPAQAEALMDTLWEQENLECRMLAASLLGMAPVSPAGPVIERLEKWLPQAEERLVETLLDKGLARLRREDRAHFTGLVREWITSAGAQQQQLGLRALVYPIKEGSFEDLPVLFHMITPLVRSSSSTMRPSLVRLLAALARRSPRETAYLLKENLDFPGAPWLARHVIQEFPPEVQETLRDSLRILQRR
jgi:hypothetical protein